MLVAPMEKEELIVYLAAAKETLSAVMMTEREAKQMPIYFVSRALRGPEVNYTSMDKLVLALVHASKRLKIYFQAHPIIVITDQPIQQVLSRPEVTRRLQKWSIELGEYAIHYRPRVSVKGQILADFIVKRPEEEPPNTLMGEEEELPEPWILFDATNNEAEYEALIAGLKIAEQMGVKNLQAMLIHGWPIKGTKEKVDKYSERVGSSKRGRGYMDDSHLQVPHGRNIAGRSEKSESSKTALQEPELCSKERYIEVLVGMHAGLPITMPVPRSPQQKLSPITSPWPFYKWGIDIAGPFPEGPGKVKFLIVAIDYFTKWIEAKPVATITGNQIKKFMWDNDSSFYTL
ncbi:reverse transcriptase domain-containing protein [Tanacetum coccineum]